jgi:hypothetical protein
LPHPCSPNRGKPLDAPPCREAPTRRALCSGDPAFEPCFSSARGCSRVSRPAAPLCAAATTSPWRCPARRHSMSRRALRLVFLEAGLHAVGLFFLQERSCGRSASCAPQRLGPGTPRRWACAAAVAPPFSGAARYALCHPVSRPSSRRVLALSVKRWGWKCWSAPPAPRPNPHRRPTAGARAGDVAPCCELCLQVLACFLAAWSGAPQHRHQAATGDDVAGGAAPSGNGRMPRGNGRHLTLGILDPTGARMGLKLRPDPTAPA